MKHLILAALITLPDPGHASPEQTITETIRGIAQAADARDWKTLDDKFADHVVLNQLSLATTTGARVQEQTVVEAWSALFPQFDTTEHAITGIEIHEVTRVIARATARYTATYARDGETWQQTGRLDYLLKNMEGGWQVTALNTTPLWENRPLTELLPAEAD